MPTPSPESDTPLSIHEDTLSSYRGRSVREEIFTRLEGEREGTYFSRTVRQYVLCTLTIEEWKTVQQLFAEAVSVNLST